MYIAQGMGVGGFRRYFGGRSNAKGSATPEHHAKAAGGVIRHAMQQLEAMGLVEKNPAARGGRRITPEGQRQVRGLGGGCGDAGWGRRGTRTAGGGARRVSACGKDSQPGGVSCTAMQRAALAVHTVAAAVQMDAVQMCGSTWCARMWVRQLRAPTRGATVLQVAAPQLSAALGQAVGTAHIPV